jgi:hypothetical protein
MQQGVETTVYCATAPELKGRGGLYYENCNESTSILSYAKLEDEQEKLWTLSEKLTGTSFPTTK